MANNKKLVLPDTISDIGFNLEAQEQFVVDKGVLFEHFAAIPSTIGLKDRGDYRRPDSLDTISENGFIYKKIGEFRAVVVGNGKQHDFGSTVEGGIYDNSRGRIVIPKFYSKTCDGSKKKEISLLPGDRIYASKLPLKVSNYQRANFTPKQSDVLQFPAVCVDFLSDSNNIEYKQGVDFKISPEGNVKWITGKANPGIDPDTGKGRVYGIRYKYVAFWYISELINEIRVTNDVDGNPQRMPYHAGIQREYIYHNKNRGDAQESNVETFTERTTEKPTESIEPNQFEVKVDIRDYSD